jgi:hypothetical protein
LNIQSLILKGSLNTDVMDTLPLEEYEKALMGYIRNMSAGKVLLTP